MAEYDIQEFVELSEAMHAESDSDDLPFSAKKMRQVAWDSMGSPRLLAAMAINNNAQLVGFLLARYEQPFFSDAMVTNEYAFFVHPEDRGSSAAAKLIKHYQLWGKALAAKKIFISANSGVKNNSVAKFYKRLGFSQQGYNFVMEG